MKITFNVVAYTNETEDEMNQAIIENNSSKEEYEEVLKEIITTYLSESELFAGVGDQTEDEQEDERMRFSHIESVLVSPGQYTEEE